MGDLPTLADPSNREGRGVSVTAEGRRATVDRPGWLADEMDAEIPEVVHSAVEEV